MKNKKFLFGFFGVFGLMLLLVSCSSRDLVGDDYDARNNLEAREFCAEELADGLVTLALFRDDLQSILADQEILSGEELNERLYVAIRRMSWHSPSDSLRYTRSGLLAGDSIIGPRGESIAGTWYSFPCGDFHVGIATDHFYNSMGWIESALAIAEVYPDAAFGIIQVTLRYAIFSDETLSTTLYSLIWSDFFNSQLLAVKINAEDLSEDTKQVFQRLIERHRTSVYESNIRATEDGRQPSDWDAWYEK